MTHPSRVLNLDMKAKALYAIYIYIYIYIRGKKGRNYISRQACFVNRFTLQGFKSEVKRSALALVRQNFIQ